MKPDAVTYAKKRVTRMGSQVDVSGVAPVGWNWGRRSSRM
jgi:hypothetical protein